METHPNSEQHHFQGLGPGLHKKKRAGRVPAVSVLQLPSEDVTGSAVQAPVARTPCYHELNPQSLSPVP